MNTKTPWGGWAKAVLMQEGDLPTVADCCRVAALLETNVPDLEKEIEAEHVRTLAEARDYLASLCGLRHWHRLRHEDALAISKAAQSIVNEFAEHFAVALGMHDAGLLKPETTHDATRAPANRNE